MKRTLTTLRCVPRFGYDFTEVRTVDLDLEPDYDELALEAALHDYFTRLGIADAVFGIATDDDGFFAIINDEAYHHDWGERLL